MSKTNQDSLRKEVFDYLRQLQKREEQTAKISGLSSWVLVGAMWYLSAWFFDHIENYSQQALLLGIALGLNFFFLQLLISPSRPSFPTTDARLMQFTSDDSTSVGLVTFNFGIAVALPALASFWLFGPTLPVVFAALFLVIFLISSLLGPLIKQFIKKPFFRAVDHPSKTTSFVMILISILALLFQTKHLFETATSMTKVQLVFSLYVSAMWWSTLQLLRTAGSKATVKHYERLEEALMFHIATPEDILKRLELQAFGPSLEKELQVLEESIKAADEIRKSAQESFEITFEQTKTVPSFYKHEINNRLTIAFSPLKEATDNLIHVIEEKVDYIGTLLVIRPTQLTPVAKQLIEKEHAQLRTRFNGLKDESYATSKKLEKYLASIHDGVTSNQLPHIDSSTDSKV